MKNILKQILPYRLILAYRKVSKYKFILLDFIYDFNRFNTHSSSCSKWKAGQLEGKIIAHYHVIEKGLSYDNIRFGFGFGIVTNLIDLLEQYTDHFNGKGNLQYYTAISVVKKYIKLHAEEGFDISRVERKFVDSGLSDITGVSDLGGTLYLDKKELFEKRNIDFKNFAFSRFSIRDFTPKNVELTVIKDAIKIAQKSPSVCNRQTSRVYIVSDKNKIQQHLSFQSGNRGFGHKINKLLIVTSDVNYFEGGIERNQSFVDGGIFSMSLLNGLHYLGLGSITLNWCVNRKRDVEYRKMSGIKNNENIILMIGVGHIPDKIKVPKSERKALDEIITLL